MMKRSTIFLTIGGLVLLIVLAAGAYTAVQLLAKPEEETAVPVGEGRVIQSVQVENDGSPVSVRTTILPAPELPQTESAAFGILKQREDNSLMIGTGDIELSVDVEVDGATGRETTSVVPSTSGPKLEVVITRDTIIYRDVTDLTADAPTESGEREIVQQVRQIDSLDDLPDNAEIEVWGERSGDRIVADVLVFGPLAGGAFE
ncbi:MAG: hypothetical protein KC421_03225 [Anaerolineales bacterium]|nr:hypothetical protein [Anaerolineales bacterium]